MQPSSLIFVLVVAIWAIYLLQHWIKRRDHLATVRSADRFSDAMRILGEQRMEQRADRGGSLAARLRPTLAARPAPGEEDVAAQEDHGEQPTSGRSLPGFVHGISQAPRRVRGLALVASIVLLPVLGVLAVTGALPGWLPLAWLVVVGVAFVWLRRCVVRERAVQVSRVRVERSAPRTRTAPVTRRRAAEPVPAAAPRRERAPERRSELYDITADEPATPVAETAPVAAAPAQPGTWQPTPVPRPTYTMKAKAAHAPVAPASTHHSLSPTGSDVPQVIDVEDEELPAIVGWH